MLKAADYLEALYRQTYDVARRVYPMLPTLPPDLIVDPKARTTERSFAFFQYDPKDSSKLACSVHLSPELAADPGRAEGVTAHELGHYVDYLLGSETKKGKSILLQRIRDEEGYPFAASGYPLPRSAERLADAIAESFLDRPITYDCEGLVQTTDPQVRGLRPRPKGLG